MQADTHTHTHTHVCVGGRSGRRNIRVCRLISRSALVGYVSLILCADCLLIRLLHAGADKRIQCCCDSSPVIYILRSDSISQR